MYAVFQLAGFQFRAEEGSVLRVPKQEAAVGTKVDLTDVLLVKDGETTTIGTPTVDGAKIEAEVVSNGLADKVLVFKFKRRTKYRRTQGHRQPYSEIKIKKIVSPQA
ncbi:MAG: 50S ribosomal protein L21 [candidate division Zixibacteria bacterium]|nr:50S ribosomal protein L21 [candidate division Zixibacteria bacterium]